MSPWERVTVVLLEAKRQGLPWHRAWLRAMEALSPERTTGFAEMIRPELEEDRDLLRECKPFIRACYEGGEIDLSELERAQADAEKRLDSLMAA